VVVSGARPATAAGIVALAGDPSPRALAAAKAGIGAIDKAAARHAVVPPPPPGPQPPAAPQPQPIRRRERNQM